MDLLSEGDTSPDVSMLDSDDVQDDLADLACPPDTGFAIDILSPASLGGHDDDLLPPASLDVHAADADIVAEDPPLTPTELHKHIIAHLAPSLRYIFEGCI